MDATKLQAWWAHRQGLDGALEGRKASEVLEKTGWARSVGGVGPYLTLFARAGISREAADAAVAKLEIHELPSARGCTYVVPASDFALALKAGQGFADSADMRTAEKLGVTSKEIDRLCEKVLDALSKGPKDPDELREAVGSAVRNLGEAGKKKGLTTTLPVALGRLQNSGEIRRVPMNGRLDQQRYRYALWKPNPLAKFKSTKEEVYVELARRFFRWIGPATLAEFQAFAGLGVKTSKDAAAPLKLVPLADGDKRLLLPDDHEKLSAFEVPKKPRISVVSSLDGLVLLRRNLNSLTPPEYAGKKVLGDKTLEPVGGLMDLPSHGIFDRGRLAGLWEYDVDSSSIVWMTFGPKTKEIADEVKKTEGYVRDQLGDARSFSLDSPKSRAPRIAQLRKAG